MTALLSASATATGPILPVAVGSEQRWAFLASLGGTSTVPLPDGIVMSLDDADADTPPPHDYDSDDGGDDEVSIYEGSDFMEAVAANIDANQLKLARTQILQTSAAERQTVVEYLEDRFSWRHDKAVSVVKDLCGRPVAENSAPDIEKINPNLDTSRGDAENSAPDKSPHMGMLLFGDINDAASTDRLVKGLIGEESFNVVAGPSGSGKTFIGLHVSVCAALGREFFGRKTLPCGVLYVGAEGQAGLKKRIKAWKIHNGITGADVPFALFPAPIDLVTDHHGAEAIVERLKHLKGLWPTTTRWLVVIDTLARCFGSGDESATQDMNTFVTRCDSIRTKASAAVLIVHHFGKDESKGMRGSVALKAAADTVIEITGMEGPRTAKVEKQKDGETGEKFNFTLKPVVVGKDEDGQDITSCVVEPTMAEAADKAGPLSAPCRIALQALKDAIAEQGSWPPAGAADHPGNGHKGVNVDVWRAVAYRRQITETDTADARKTAFRRASEQLQARKIVGCHDKFVWVLHD